MPESFDMPMPESFGRRLHAAVAVRGPLCVGIDPHGALLRSWDLADDATGLERFALSTVEAMAGEVAIVKPQSAFFERHGSAGVAVLEKTIAAAKQAGLLVVLDVKRGDIGSTASAYADAYLDPSSPLGSDAITVSPFLGFGSLTPFIETAERHGAGVFVLTLTSNEEGPQVQRARTADGTVAGTILTQIRAHNAGAEPLGSIGAVVGATVGEICEDVAINGPLLVPGFGAQGGTVEDIRRLFKDVDALVLPTTSRAVLAAGPDVSTLRSAARQVSESLRG